MSRDLESQLDELGPEYRAVVARLRAGREAEPSASRLPSFVSRHASRVFSSSSRVFRLASYLTAASLLLLVGLGVLFQWRGGRETTDARREAGDGERGAPGAREYQLAVSGSEASMREMIATQNADGSWKNDFLTRQNAAALKLCDSAEARVAYKKAVRNLRVRGVL